MWIPDLACPQCRRRLVADGIDWQCPHCARWYRWRQQILRALPPEAVARMAPFVEQYRRVRDADGYRPRDAAYYRRLPQVADDDPRAAEWRIRRDSFRQFCRVVLEPAGSSGIRVLDLGAGSGWLSHQLTAAGHNAVAVDLLDDDADGLGVCRYYPIPFALVQAQFEALPFAGGCADVVVFNASLHYAAESERVLVEARRVLLPGGTIVVMDSPMFARAQDGEAMVRAQAADFRTRYGIAEPERPGTGYLTFAGLQAAVTRLGMRGRFHPTRGPLGWRLRRLWARLKIGRAPASFGAWVAR